MKDLKIEVGQSGITKVELNIRGSADRDRALKFLADISPLLEDLNDAAKMAGKKA